MSEVRESGLGGGDSLREREVGVVWKREGDRPP